MRLDAAEWLARNAAGAAHTPPPPQRKRPERTAGDSPEGRRPDAETSDNAERLGAMNVSDSETYAVSAAATDIPTPPDVVDQVNVIAKAMTEDIWQEIVESLPGSPDEVRAIRLQLADHGWCDLLIGFVLVLEKFGKAVDTVPDKAKRLIVEAIRGSSKQEKRPQLDEVVVGMIVDKAWGAFKVAAAAHSPLFGLLTGDELLRNLRMLAVFICPAPEKHEEVRNHAVDPLVKDACGYVSTEAKEWLAQQFDQWVEGVEQQVERNGAGESGRATEAPVANLSPK
ncbi:hypothetical protein ACFORH_20015 [Amycolatopsis roodepoortensis]|uniref:Uncharacterized protein YjeT (DUF2065 family) n=1 Tax=Amycolatopsis roodepoortensis TaxID=700274 RepID=A0ABR9LEM6_9PSEU|nr:hypothetical protein [Amycolatopsis roodepoortensis]MBE1578757.1 uncharacterized protein YjeT (DUF2065 family) [Amycolatopsis roodepoortensis]